VKSLDQKLAAIHADPSGCREFIIADAKDADMAFGVAATGWANSERTRFRTLEEYRNQMRQIVRQGIVDIMLMSNSSSEALTLKERLFEGSPVTPAIRANDATDIWVYRGSTIGRQASRPFRSASIDHAQCGHLDCRPDERSGGANLGLYSITFNNDRDFDLETLQAFRDFREEAERKRFRYFLEVFAPNAAEGLDPDQTPYLMIDAISRALAGVTSAGRPLFLKIPYLGPKALEQLVSFDPHLIVGVLGGSAGTTHDAFSLIHQSQRYGARVALFGRKINQAEDQLLFIEHLRRICDGDLDPGEAVKSYHGGLESRGIRPDRALADDLALS
jgi:hypothetical protein